MLGVDVEHERHVAERNIQIDERHARRALLSERHGQIGGQRCLADAALDPEHRDDAAGRRSRVVSRGRDAQRVGVVGLDQRVVQIAGR